MVTALEQIGGTAALDFANTREGDPEPEHLHGYGDVVAWAAHSGVIDAATARRLTSAARGRPAEDSFESALRLRAAIDAFEADAIPHAPLAPAPTAPAAAVGRGSGSTVDPGSSPIVARFDWSW